MPQLKFLLFCCGWFFCCPPTARHIRTVIFQVFLLPANRPPHSCGNNFGFLSCQPTLATYSCSNYIIYSFFWFVKSFYRYFYAIFSTIIQSCQIANHQLFWQLYSSILEYYNLLENQIYIDSLFLLLRFSQKLAHIC